MITGGKFIKAHGTPVPFNPPPTLVTGGLYSYVRNPMIAGNIFLLFGLGILVNSISVAFIFTPIFVLLHAMNLKFIEEPELERRFGDEYMDYKKRTPMFFPGFKKKDSMSSC
jgi:protein-S-isoprenylcysteine O-methyltransferase Ste14